MDSTTNCFDVNIAPEFQSIKDKLSNFSVFDFSNLNKVNEYCDLFSIKELCKHNKEGDNNVNSNEFIFTSTPENTAPYMVQYDELC
jgi:hypothetical protein